MANGAFGRLLRRLTADDDELDAESLVSETRQRGTCSCAQADPGELASVAGRIRSVVYTPSENAPFLTAELYDGSGSIRLVWLGQRQIPGIEPGRRLTARGRVAERDGECAIYNPWYELQAT